MTVLILSEAELCDCVAMDGDALGAIGQAFAWLAEDKVDMPL